MKQFYSLVLVLNFPDSNILLLIIVNNRTSIVARLVKNPPAMWETWVRSLDWEDILEKGQATHSSILAWRIPWTVYSPWCRKELDITERLSYHII